MDIDEVENIVDCYYSRKKLIEENNKPSYLYINKDGLFKSYKAVRARRIESFVFDALLLKDLECVDHTICSEYRFKPSSTIQYFSLNKIQLICYIGFRTSLRKGISPLNNHLAFLSLYIMEILNGVVDSSFKAKFNLLINVHDLYSYRKEFKMFKKIMSTAFELLYIQHMDEINKLKYFNDVPLPIFDKTSLSLDNEQEFITYSIFNVVYRSIKRYKNWKDIMNYSGDCFKFVYLELLADKNFNLYEYNSVEELFNFSRNTKMDNNYNGFKVLFPIKRDFAYCSESGDEESFKNGVHSKTRLYYISKQEELINIFIKAVCISMDNNKSMQLNCDKGVDSLILFVKDLYDNCDSSYIQIKPDRMDLSSLYRKVDLAVVHWMNDEKQTVKKSPYITSYELDINDVDMVRSKSREIQAKLIIEEEEEEEEEKEQNTSIATSFADTLVNVDTREERTFKSFVVSLLQYEKDVLISFISHDIKEAESIAFNSGQPLSVVVDKINIKSDLHIEDIVIEGNEIVDDYRDEIEFELNN